MGETLKHCRMLANLCVCICQDYTKVIPENDISNQHALKRSTRWRFSNLFNANKNVY
jgi:hypothetical protein